MCLLLGDLLLSELSVRSHDSADQTSELLVETLNAVADGLGETFDDVAHYAEVGHVVHVSFLRRRRDGLQLVLVGVLYTCRETDRQTDIQTDMQTDRHTHRQTRSAVRLPVSRNFKGDQIT